MVKATVHISSRPMTPAPVLYRCKPTEYFTDIKRNCNYMMHPYLKDNNGDQANPINNNIMGLFFNARLANSGDLPATSPFGTVRFTIPVHHIIKEDSHLYFADFYCLAKPVHYITIVVCTSGSQADLYCQDHLIKLDNYDNPFLYINKDLDFAFLGQNCWVEVFVTDSIDLRYEMMAERCFFDLVPTTGRGSSTLNGLPKNATCNICNIYEEEVDMFANKRSWAPMRPHQNKPKVPAKKVILPTQKSAHGVKRKGSLLLTPDFPPKKTARVSNVIPVPPLDFSENGKTILGDADEEQEQNCLLWLDDPLDRNAIDFHVTIQNVHIQKSQSSSVKLSLPDKTGIQYELADKNALHRADLNAD